MSPSAIKSRIGSMLDALDAEEQRSVFRFTEYLYLSVELDRVQPGEMSPAEKEAIERAPSGQTIPWNEAMKQLGLDKIPGLQHGKREDESVAG